MNRTRIALAGASLALAAGLGYAVRVLAAGIPPANALTYAGVLEDSNGPVTAMHNIQVIFYDAASAGNNLCQSTTAAINVTNGHFSVQLPDTCTSTVGGNPGVWADVLVDGSDTGRTKISAVPYAVEANHTPNADNATSASYAADAGHATSCDTAANASNATTAGTANAAGGTLSTTLTSIQTNLSALGLNCTVRAGSNTTSSLFSTGSVAVCNSGETLTGGMCSPYSGRGGPIGTIQGNGIRCALATPSSDPSDYVFAQAVCCQL